MQRLERQVKHHAVTAAFGMIAGGVGAVTDRAADRHHISHSFKGKILAGFVGLYKFVSEKVVFVKIGLIFPLP